MKAIKFSTILAKNYSPISDNPRLPQYCSGNFDSLPSRRVQQIYLLRWNCSNICLPGYGRWQSDWRSVPPEEDIQPLHTDGRRCSGSDGWFTAGISPGVHYSSLQRSPLHSCRGNSVGWYRGSYHYSVYIKRTLQPSGKLCYHYLTPTRCTDPIVLPVLYMLTVQCT